MNEDSVSDLTYKASGGGRRRASAPAQLKAINNESGQDRGPPPAFADEDPQHNQSAKKSSASVCGGLIQTVFLDIVLMEISYLPGAIALHAQ